jgi:hypothetical protein
MYSTKSIHKNINPNYPQDYNTVDPYSSNHDELPERWKSKQFVTQRHPKNAHNGLFSKLEYDSAPYTEFEDSFKNTQPLETRKLGFGSKDAFKCSEFTNTKAMERYRDFIRHESKLMDRYRDKTKEKELLERYGQVSIRETPRDKQGLKLKEPKFLYDIGRTHVTPYDPNSSRASFYKIPKNAPVDPSWKGVDPIRRLGPHRPVSLTYGEMAWSHKYEAPKHGMSNCVDKFFDRGHLECKGF